MKKRSVMQFDASTPEYVMAHGVWQKGRGRMLSVSYAGERNPRKALALALDAFSTSLTITVKIERGWNRFYGDCVSAYTIGKGSNHEVNVGMTRDEAISNLRKAYPYLNRRKLVVV